MEQLTITRSFKEFNSWSRKEF